MRINDLVALASLAVYAVNRYFLSFDFILPYDFAHYHLGDLCGGVLFPAYVNLVTLSLGGFEAISSIPKAALLGLGCSVAWEIITPLLLPSSTGDVLDALAYVAGSLIYAVCYRCTQKGRQI